MATLEEIVSLLQINPSTLGGGGATGSQAPTQEMLDAFPPQFSPLTPPQPIPSPVGGGPGPVAPFGPAPNPRPGGTTFPAPTPNPRPGGTTFAPLGGPASTLPGLQQGPSLTPLTPQLEPSTGFKLPELPLNTRTGFDSNQSPLSPNLAAASQSLPPGPIPNPRPGGTTLGNLPTSTTTGFDSDQPPLITTTNTGSNQPRGLESGLDVAGLTGLQTELQSLLPPGFNFFPGTFTIGGPGLGPTGTLEIPTNLTTSQGIIDFFFSNQARQVGSGSTTGSSTPPLGTNTVVPPIVSGTTPGSGGTSFSPDFRFNVSGDDASVPSGANFFNALFSALGPGIASGEFSNFFAGPGATGNPNQDASSQLLAQIAGGGDFRTLLANIGKQSLGDSTTFGAPGIQSFLEQNLRDQISGGGVSDQFVQAARERILQPALDRQAGISNRQGGGVADINSGIFQRQNQELESNFLNDLILFGGSNLQNSLAQAGQLGAQQFGQGASNRVFGAGAQNQLIGQSLSTSQLLASLGLGQQGLDLQGQGQRNEFGLGQSAIASDLIQTLLAGREGGGGSLGTILALLSGSGGGGGIFDVIKEVIDIFRDGNPNEGEPTGGTPPINPNEDQSGGGFDIRNLLPFLESIPGLLGDRAPSLGDITFGGNGGGDPFENQPGGLFGGTDNPFDASNSGQNSQEAAVEAFFRGEISIQELKQVTDPRSDCWYSTVFGFVCPRQQSDAFDDE